MSRARLVAAVPTLIAALLLLWRLDNGALWQDEAQTALLSRSVLLHGVPLGIEGDNSFSQELGVEFGPNAIWRWHTWLPFYLLAGFFRLFGQTTAVARLPFALAGVATVALCGPFAARLYRSRKVAGLAAALLSICVPFLLLGRQSRYYTLAALLSLLSLHGYLRFRDGARGGRILLCIASTALFHTHYLYCATLWGTVGLHALWFQRARLRGLFAPLVATALLNFPFVLWLSRMPYGSHYQAALLQPRAWLDKALAFRDWLLGYVVPPAFSISLLSALAVALYARRRGRLTFSQDIEGHALVGLFVLSNLGLLIVVAPGGFARYLAPIVPPLLCGLAALLSDLSALHRALPYALLVPFALHNGLPQLCDELTHRFEGPVDGLVQYLRAHSRPGQLLAITYEDLPLKFYLDLRVLGGLTGQDLTPAQAADFIVLRHQTVCSKDQAVAEYLRSHVPWEKYRRVELAVPDTLFQNRENQPEHLFRTAVDRPKVVVYQRIAPTAPTAPITPTAPTAPIAPTAPTDATERGAGRPDAQP